MESERKSRNRLTRYGELILQRWFGGEGRVFLLNGAGTTEYHHPSEERKKEKKEKIMKAKDFYLYLRPYLKITFIRS